MFSAYNSESTANNKWTDTYGGEQKGEGLGNIYTSGPEGPSVIQTPDAELKKSVSESNNTGYEINNNRVSANWSTERPAWVSTPSAKLDLGHDEVNVLRDNRGGDNEPNEATVDPYTNHVIHAEECGQEMTVIGTDKENRFIGRDENNPLCQRERDVEELMLNKMKIIGLDAQEPEQCQRGPPAQTEASLTLENRFERGTQSPKPEEDMHSGDSSLKLSSRASQTDSTSGEDCLTCKAKLEMPCGDQLRQTPLQRAVIEGNMRSMIQCAEKGYDLDERFVMRKDCDVVCILEDWSYPDTILVSATPLHVAVTQGNYNMTQALLNAGCDANSHVLIHEDGASEKKDTTALHIAIHQGHTDIVDLLLQQAQDGKCNVSSMTANGTQPIHLAICNGLYQVLENLTRLGCDVTTHYHSEAFGRRTPIQLAANVGHAGIIEALMKTRKIKDINEPCPDTGMNPLHIALQYNNDEAAIKLLQYGARWDKNDFDGKKPIDYASKESPVPQFLFKTILQSHNSVTLKGRVPRNLQRTQTDSEKLKMVGKVKGMCFIINNNEFIDGTTRIGTMTDEESLRRMFTNLGFLVVVFRDLTKKQMESALNLAQQYDHSEHDYFFCVVLSHGKSGEFYGVDMEPMKMQTFSSLLEKRHCESLAKKPKVLIVQACQGSKDAKPDATTDRPVETDASPTCDEDTKWFPTEENFIFYSSTLPGFVSYRDTDGATFIKRFVSRIDQIPLDVQVKFSDVVEDINKDMAEHPENGGKQVPIYMTTSGSLYLARCLGDTAISDNY